MDELSRREIDLFLAEELVGRIGCHAQGQTYVVPVIYAYDGEAFYAHSVEGLKLRMMRANPQVCFEVDHYYGSGNWTSVIARGAFEQLEGSAAERALTLLLDRFPPGSRSGREKTEGCPSSSFRILVGEISGRQMRRLNRRGRVQLWDGDRRLDDEFREVARRVERGGVSRAFDPTGARAGDGRGERSDEPSQVVRAPRAIAADDRSRDRPEVARRKARQPLGPSEFS